MILKSFRATLSCQCIHAGTVLECRQTSFRKHEQKMLTLLSLVVITLWMRSLLGRVPTRNVHMPFTTAGFYVATGPASLFRRAEHILPLRLTQHAGSRLREKVCHITRANVVVAGKLNGASTSLCRLDKVTVRTDTGKFISSAWRCEITRKWKRSGLGRRGGLTPCHPNRLSPGRSG
jgi:hypothetical protein